MKRSVRHILSFVILFSLGLSGCVKEQCLDGCPPTDNTVKLELFTRSNNYGVPVSRASAQEFTAAKDPWVLVFKGTGATATFVEAKQAYVADNRSFIELTEGSGQHQLLVYANTGTGFYIGNTPHAWAEFEGSTPPFGTSATLAQVSEAILTAPLSSPQTTAPFVGGSLTMGAVVQLDNGISQNTVIPDINLGRTVAKVIVKNTDTSDTDGDSQADFSLTGITAVINTPKQGRWHSLTTDPAYNTVSGGTNLIEYRTDDSYAADIAPAGTESTADNPIYLYESETGTGDNDTYIIIRAMYKGEPLFYKMAFVDDSGSQLNILRNTEYEFTILSVNGRGYSSVADAMQSRPSNTNLNYAVTVTNTSSYEIMANNDYYVGVTNSHFEVYAPADGTSEHTAFTLVTDYKGPTPFPTKNHVKSLTTGMTVSTEAIPVNTTAPFDVKVKLSAGFSEGRIELHLGSLKKIITVRRHDPVSNTIISSFIPDEGGTPYSYVSAYVDGYPMSGDTPQASYWLQLSPGGQAVRNDPHRIFADDGNIDLHVGSNPGNAGDVYVSTKYRTIRRIKVRITQ